MKKWTIPSIIFSALYILSLSKWISIALSRNKFRQIYSKYDVTLPPMTFFFFNYGNMLGIVIMLGTLGLLVRDGLKNKVITFKASVISFLIFFVWTAIELTSCYLPILKLSSDIGK